MIGKAREVRMREKSDTIRRDVNFITKSKKLQWLQTRRRVGSRRLLVRTVGLHKMLLQRESGGERT